MPLSIGVPEQPIIHSTDLARRREDGSQRNEPEEAMVAHRLQARRGNAAALRAVGGAAELAWADPPLQICRDIQRGAREDTLIRCLRRFAITFDYGVGQDQLREHMAQLCQFV